MMRSIRLLAAALALAATPAFAQPEVARAPEPRAIEPSAPEPRTIEPPGPGMVESPCPVLPEPMDSATRQALGAYLGKHDWPWLCRYRAANAAVKARPNAVFMGDSITEFWAALDPAFFSARVLDRGISGQTTPQMVLRFRADVIALRPRIVHIMGGTNDIAGNTGPESPEQFKDNIRTMVDLAQANGIAVVLGAIPPAAAFRWKPAVQPAPRIVELNRWLKDYAASRRLTFADYHTALAGPDGGMKPGASDDGVHPNAAGYGLMRDVALRALVRARPLAPCSKP